jgi:hypothetical protein
VRIDAAIPSGLYVQQHGKLDTGKEKVDHPKPSTSDLETAQSSLEPTGSAENDDKKTETSKGVLGLLQEGHFKGVADVRLRINFSDELAAIEQNQSGQIVNQKIDVILDSVTSALKSGQFTETPLDSLIDPFEQAINESKENFLTAEVQSTSILMNELQSAFETLAISLTQAFASTAAENPEEGVFLVDTAMDEDTPASHLVAGLKVAFSTAMDDLAKALSDATKILPELSEPNGNGVAYEKFLTIYNEMQSSREPENPTSDTVPLDTSA